MQTFTEWRKTVDLNRFGTSDPIAGYARAAFEAGVQAERERTIAGIRYGTLVLSTGGPAEHVTATIHHLPKGK